jgi:hypothetical protein
LSAGAAIRRELRHGSRAGFVVFFNSCHTLAHHAIPVGRRDAPKPIIGATTDTCNTGLPEKNPRDLPVLPGPAGWAIK